MGADFSVGCGASRQATDAAKIYMKHPQAPMSRRKRKIAYSLGGDVSRRSTATDRRSEDVSIHGVIVAELKLRNIEGHILAAHLVESPNNAALLELGDCHLMNRLLEHVSSRRREGANPSRPAVRRQRSAWRLAGSHRQPRAPHNQAKAE